MFENTYKILKEEKAVAVIRTSTYEEAKEISIAVIEGGIKIIEVTMSVPDAPKLIKELKDKYNDVCVGAGTVLSRDNVDECIENGTDFIVSPCLDEEVIGYANQRKVLVIPGLMTMSELNRAYKMGLRFIKVFPRKCSWKRIYRSSKINI